MVCQAWHQVLRRVASKGGVSNAPALFFIGVIKCLKPPHSEFWKDIKPIEKVFREGGLPEVYASKIAEGDERYWVPISETVSSKPVWISPSKNMWADVLMSK